MNPNPPYSQPGYGQQPVAPNWQAGPPPQPPAPGPPPGAYGQAPGPNPYYQTSAVQPSGQSYSALPMGFMPGQAGPPGPQPGPYASQPMQPMQPAAPVVGIPGTFGGVAGNPIDVVAQSAMQVYGARLIQGGSTFVQKQMGFFSGEAFYHLFNINHTYVARKMLLLACPFISSAPKLRKREQMSGVSKFEPPRLDVNSPDLYIPLMGLLTWVLLTCLGQVAEGKFTTDMMYAMLWRGSIVWALQTILSRVVLSLGSHSAHASVPYLELTAYSGYMYVFACVVSLARTVLGAAGRTVALLYSWVCLAVFLRNTFNRVIVDEMKVGATDPRQRYMILALMLGQGFWLWVLSG